MAKIINLFNHKSGVSKTTTVFNLSWMLGSLGERVLMADFDPQCNLTGMVLGYQGIDDLENTYQSDPPNNIKDALAPAFESKPKQIAATECDAVTGRVTPLLGRRTVTRLGHPGRVVVEPAGRANRPGRDDLLLDRHDAGNRF